MLFGVSTKHFKGLEERRVSVSSYHVEVKMRPKPSTPKSLSEKLVKDIRRATRKLITPVGASYIALLRSNPFRLCRDWHNKPRDLACDPVSG